MSKPDFNRAALLLHIVESANPAKWPKLRPLFDAAMAELEAIAGAKDLDPTTLRPSAAPTSEPAPSAPTIGEDRPDGSLVDRRV